VRFGRKHMLGYAARALALSVTAFAAAVLAAEQEPVREEPGLFSTAELEALYKARTVQIQAAKKQKAREVGFDMGGDCMYPREIMMVSVPYEAETLDALLRTGKRVLARDPVDWGRTALVLGGLSGGGPDRRVESLAQETLRKPVPDPRPVDFGIATGRATVLLIRQNTDSAWRTLEDTALIAVQNPDRQVLPTAEGKRLDEHYALSEATTVCRKVVSLGDRDRIVPFMERVVAAYPESHPFREKAEWYLEVAQRAAAGDPNPWGFTP
jgi:hypothetical protein